MWKMLFYKSWLETRSRFLWCLSLTLASVSHTVFTAPSVVRSIHQQVPWVEVSFTRYLWTSVYAGSLLAAWVALVVMLAMGGLRGEQSSGALAFTLSLPVRRSGSLVTQAAVGFAESIAFAFLPAFLIPGLSSLAGEVFSLSQALQHAILLAGAGELLYGWAFLVSQMTQGRFGSLAVSLSSIGVFFVLVKKIHALDDFDIFDTMTGIDLLNRHTFLIEGRLPWLSLATTTSLFVGMICISMFLIERHDF